MSELEFLRQANRIYSEVSELPPERREAYLAAACADRPELRDKVERLLSAEAKIGTFLEQPAEELARAARQLGEPEIGTHIGPYRLAEVINRGGMGTVFLAERDDDQYQHRVALKVIQPWLLGSLEGLRRFRHERQTLARLEHPGIARLYDGGTTEAGWPYLVMEYVEGEPLDQYCDRHRLGVRARLELVGKLCEAVQYAHQNLLVHRDIKPSNVLVTAQGELKLLDFGIAKRLDEAEQEGDSTQFTRLGLRLMTPAYASPEQVRGEPVSTASDVYSLGVLLYELLSGLSPYRGEDSKRTDLERAVCEEEPERPSAALRELLRRAVAGDAAARAETEDIASARSSEPKELARRLAGDLDNILAKALRKEPQRRFVSAAELATDLDRHLRDQPVQARPDSLRYRTGKFLRRHRLSVSAAALAVSVLAALTVSLLVQRQRLTRERDKSNQALNFLVKTFEEADPYRGGGDKVSVRTLLDQGEKRVEEQLSAQPQVKAALLDAIGRSYLGLGALDQGQAVLDEALKLRRRLAETSPQELASSLEGLSDALYQQGEFAKAEELGREALALRRRLPGTDPRALGWTLNRLASTLTLQRKFDEARKLLEESREVHRRVEGDAGEGLAETLGYLAKLEFDQGHYPEAEGLYREVLAMERKVLGPEDPVVASTLGAMGGVFTSQGRFREATEAFGEGYRILLNKLGANHPDTAALANNLGLARLNLGDYREAARVFRDALAVFQASWGADHPQTAKVMGSLELALQGMASEGADTLAEADRLDRSVLEIVQKAFGPEHPAMAEALAHLGKLRHLQGRDEEALAAAGRSLALYQKFLGPEHPLASYPMSDLGYFHLKMGHPLEAEPLLRHSLAIRERVLSAAHPQLARTRAMLGATLMLEGRYAEAEPLLSQAVASLSAALRPADFRLLETRGWLSELYRHWGQPERAAPEAVRPASTERPAPSSPPG
ncbi:MAG: serine/threonine-protein kinase [Thermoanaerobaculia bacterium]